jgi:Asp-tRNA(Asn)/Glu-tRNA(Gln) amidotransferase A subunit family amidase
VVGIKPTLGLVSRRGIVPISAAQDTAGPMARTVAEAAALLGVLAGPDPADPATAAAEGRPADYTAFLDAHCPAIRRGHLAELIDFNIRNGPSVLAHFGQEIFLQAEATSGDPADPAALAARAEATGRAPARRWTAHWLAAGWTPSSP